MDYVSAGTGSHLIAEPAHNKLITAYNPPPLKLFAQPFQYPRPGTALALGLGTQATNISPAAWATAVRAKARRPEERSSEPRQLSFTFSARYSPAEDCSQGKWGPHCRGGGGGGNRASNTGGSGGLGKGLKGQGH